MSLTQDADTRELTLEEVQTGERVFVQHAADEWIGVEVREEVNDDGVVAATVVYTNGIPGYEIGELHELAGETPVRRVLTVGDLIMPTDSEEEGEAVSNDWRVWGDDAEPILAGVDRATAEAKVDELVATGRSDVYADNEAGDLTHEPEL